MTAAIQAAVLRLATRGSALARAQAALASEAIHRRGGPDTELVIVRTEGDRNQAAPIEQLEGQGWFTAAIERALIDGRADVAVHAAKDLPTELAHGLAVAAVLPRADPRDAVVTRDGGGLDSLADGATVGSSSARRAAFLAELRPGLRCVPIRGNVDTRLRKLDSGEVNGLLVAVAGLDRLDLAGRIGQRLDPRRFVPAPAQGAIALEVVAAAPSEARIAVVNDNDTALAVGAERAVLRALGGGCLLPLGAWARLEDGVLVLSAALGVDGAVRRVELGGDPANPAELVDRVAAALR
ncbi:MAG: hydroxymethylbilane synthase [Candidatus Dormibacteraeota bacterium]|nr:hydroxymethylbilane synthase [Candidatus Dormibacteraeota bacterium]